MFLNFVFFLLRFTNSLFTKLGKKDLFQKIHDFLEFNQYVDVQINSKKINFFCPSSKSLFRVQTLFEKEPETINWINTFDNSKKIIFWDIGANIGLYSIYAAAKYNDIEIISFEPSTSSTRVLSRNVSINNLNKKIKIFPLALTNKSNVFSAFKETRFSEGGSQSTFGENIDSSGYQLKKGQIVNEYQIFGTSINNLIESKILKIPNYIKCDVDGLEHYILEGGKKYLNDENLLGIIIELNPTFKEQHYKVINILKENNFSLVSYSNSNLIKDKNHILKNREIVNAQFIKNYTTKPKDKVGTK